MLKHADIQYTIRGVPEEVDRALRTKARRQGISLNKIVLSELSQAAGVREKKLDFSDVPGKWVEHPAFDEIIASQRKLDWGKWK